MALEVPTIGFAAGLVFGTGCYWCTRGSALCTGPISSFEDALGEEGSEFSAKVVEYLRSEIEAAARSGFETRAEIKRAFGRRVRDEHPRASRAELARWERVADFYLDEQQKREKRWPRQTTNDRLTRAFRDLDALDGVIAIECAGYEDDAGWDQVTDVKAARAAPCLGAAFYNRRDVEAAMEGKGLGISFGAFGSSPSGDDSLEKNGEKNGEPASDEPTVPQLSYPIMEYPIVDTQPPQKKKSDDGKKKKKAPENKAKNENAVRVGRLVCAALLNRGLLPEWDGNPGNKIKLAPFEWRRRRPRAGADDDAFFD